MDDQTEIPLEGGDISGPVKVGNTVNWRLGRLTDNTMRKQTKPGTQYPALLWGKYETLLHNNLGAHMRMHTTEIFNGAFVSKFDGF